MIMKWRDMERLMAATSQPLLQGGMRSRDWFSDKLGGGGRMGTLMQTGLFVGGKYVKVNVEKCEE